MEERSSTLAVSGWRRRTTAVEDEGRRGPMKAANRVRSWTRWAYHPEAERTLLELPMSASEAAVAVAVAAAAAAAAAVAPGRSRMNSEVVACFEDGWDLERDGNGSSCLNLSFHMRRQKAP